MDDGDGRRGGVVLGRGKIVGVTSNLHDRQIRSRGHRNQWQESLVMESKSYVDGRGSLQFEHSSSQGRVAEIRWSRT